MSLNIGANLWITGRNEEKLQDTAQNCKALGAGDVVILKVTSNFLSKLLVVGHASLPPSDIDCALQSDLTNKNAVDELAEHVRDKIDILVNNAGMANPSSAMQGGRILLTSTALQP